MIRTVVAYDDNDSALGDYFEESYNNLLQAMQAAHVTPTIALSGLQCTEANVNAAVIPLNANPFLFVGLSHGDEDCLGIDSTGEIFISRANADNFVNSFFYTTACKVGAVLGNDLITKGCKTFIGYTNTSYAPSNGDYNFLFIECELYVLTRFLSTNRTINELFNEMMNYTQSKIDWLLENNEIVEAMSLQSNKDCMMLLGDGSLRRQNFELN